MSAVEDITLHPCGRIGANLALYGLAHALVDASCLGILFTLCHREALDLSEAGWYFLGYNMLAFAAQPVLGLALDRLRRPGGGAIAGCLLIALALAGFMRQPLMAVILAGAGNAMFHLGAGSICLNLTPGRALAPGIFVAPGAAGVLAGTYLGNHGTFVIWPFIVLLVILCGGMWILPQPRIDWRRKNGACPARWPILVLLLLLVSVAGRSMVGFGIVFSWQSGLPWAIILTAFVVLGKGLGGLLADRVGWIRVAVAALAIAAPLVAFGSDVPATAIAGMFLLNIPMSVTLAGTANLLPGRPGFAFGLTAMALEAGTWPVTILPGGNRELDNVWVVFSIVLGMAIILYLALQAAFHRLPLPFSRVRP